MFLKRIFQIINNNSSKILYRIFSNIRIFRCNMITIIHNNLKQHNYTIMFNQQIIITQLLPLSLIKILNNPNHKIIIAIIIAITLILQRYKMMDGYLKTMLLTILSTKYQTVLLPLSKHNQYLSLMQMPQYSYHS